MNTKIIQDKEKGVTTVVYEYCMYDAMSYIERRFSWINTNRNQSRYYMPNTIVGVSRLRDGDVWNDAEGVRMAFKKADRCHQKWMRNIIKRYLKDLITDAARIDKELVREISKGV